ncbi:class I SAM-dependent methyltransferase [Candidatus Pseudomonas adelgestsugas]|uniref:Ribosomal RNA small subunit methyltransferase C n=1 Tax=Candidatus Pseudomonas adelgestsugas TaxID=1302376 RepID=A0ABX5R8U4_9PSED|nr:class I SAM-dependent methyltransferase [Candidatus Pseudomonas adelgestsugas]QAX81841.1 Ribosomal RNA small subunit methyltransferase C [Candidatus Pseudomonas adelgestsugas]
MDQRSEVLLRQARLFQGHLLLVGLPADDLLGRLPNAYGWSWHAGDQAILDASFPERSQFGVNVPNWGFDAAVIFLPKSKDLTDYLISAVAARLDGAELFLVGEKQGGIKSAFKQMIHCGKPRKLDNARHCQLWQVTVTGAPPAVELASLIRVFNIPLTNGLLKVVSLPGVFSHGRLDHGTKLMLKHLDKLPSGHLLDFGCGAGVLGSAVKLLYPHNTVTMLDVDAFAAASSRLTIDANGLDAEVLVGDGIDTAPINLNAILSNPPFHIGVHTNYSATENLLRKSAQHIARGGELRLVANKFLKYQILIEKHFGMCEIKAINNSFCVYRAKRS